MEYHYTFNTSSLSTGSHQISAVVTDVSGATATLTTQTFNVGYGNGSITVTCNPANCAVAPCGTVALTAGSAVDWSLVANSIGSLSVTDSMQTTYTAPPMTGDSCH